ncbi:MAG: hypothetical protein JXR71_04155 [Bacteroidales bacterium]|nr:hypothetical protein [Bacteroidales bacterium]
MGTSKQGVYGAYKGRVGNVVGSSWKGTQVLRIRPASVRNPKTDAQEETRMRFKMLARFLSSQRAAVIQGFYSLPENVTAVNAAMSVNFHEAFTGAYPDLAFDFSKVKISKGNLLVPDGLTATAAEGATINLSWADNTDVKMGAQEQDALVIGVYDPVSEQGAVFSSYYRRNETTGTLKLPSVWVGRQLEVLAFYKSGADPTKIVPGFEVSNTVYGGSVTLLE